MAEGSKPQECNTDAGGVAWETVETDYITNNISLKELAQKYGLPRRTLEDRCKKGGWVAKRKKWRGDVVSGACRKARARESERLANIILLSDRLEELLGQLTEDIRDAPGIVREGKAPGREMNNLAQAIKTALEIKRDIYSLPNWTDDQRVKLAREKLRREEEREKARERAGKEPVVVTFEGGADKLSG